MNFSCFISSSETQTKKIAAELVEKYAGLLKDKCLIFALEGDLGTGKTVFAKGVAEALGIKKVIRSPSFIIQREFSYQLDDISGNFVHIDLWRMENELEVEKLKIGEVVMPGNVILIEWAEKMAAELKRFAKNKQKVSFSVKISYLKNTFRKIEIS